MTRRNRRQEGIAHGGPPFNAAFFLTVFRNWIKTKCAERADAVSVVLLHLTDGRVLDLCHIALLTPEWLAAAVYRDAPSCDGMDTDFVPFSSISGVTISRRENAERRIGFQVQKSLPALAQLAAAKEVTPK